MNMSKLAIDKKKSNQFTLLFADKQFKTQCIFNKLLEELDYSFTNKQLQIAKIQYVIIRTYLIVCHQVTTLYCSLMDNSTSIQLFANKSF